MASRITMQDSIVTGRKFVPIGSQTVSARKRLASVLSSYNETKNTLSLKEVAAIVKDNIITPEEKIALKDRWDTLSAAYTRLLSTLEDEGMTDMDGVENMQQTYSTLFAQMQNIFADMNTSSVAPDNFEDNIEKFNTAYTIVSQSYATIAYKLQAFSLRLETTAYYLAEEETAVVTATLYKGLNPYTGDKLEDIYNTLTWKVSGLKKSVDNYKSGLTLVIPEEDYDNTAIISATVDLPIAIL